MTARGGINLAGPVKDSLVYNNTIYVGPETYVGPAAFFRLGRMDRKNIFVQQHFPLLVPNRRRRVRRRQKRAKFRTKLGGSRHIKNVVVQICSFGPSAPI